MFREDGSLNVFHCKTLTNKIYMLSDMVIHEMSPYLEITCIGNKHLNTSIDHLTALLVAPSTLD